ncbi:MAG: metallophosphoesterase [Spirochaetales bacterium]|nr:metallophosphoesterase [Spirochaetales bacterium]
MADNFATLIKTLERYANLKTIPPRDQLEDLVASVTFLLNNENPLVRPLDEDEISGGLIVLREDIPTLVIPDIHGRRDFVMNFLNWNYGPGPVLEGLIKDELQVVCVGDGFHTEKRGALRWQEAFQEYALGFKRHRHMDREMADSMGVMAMIMLLKRSFPDNFHFLKGNHENIKNENNHSDRSFGKYAYEGAMVREWVEIFLGEEFLDEWSAFEQSLPLFVIGENFLVSHAEPLKFHSREEIVNFREDRTVSFDFSWTGNDQSEPGTVEAMLKEYLPGKEKTFYFGGHRPVQNLFQTRAGGRYVQIHNPEKDIVALLEPGEVIELEKVVKELKRED